MTETRCFHCKLDVAPVDEDGCCNNCGADLGCTCELEPVHGAHTDDCAISLREQRDIARSEWQGADAKAEAMQAERNEAIARVAELENAVFIAATLAGPSKPGKRPPMATEGIYRALCAVIRVGIE